MKWHLLANIGSNDNKIKIKWKHRSKLKTHFPTAWGGGEFYTLFIINVFYFILFFIDTDDLNLNSPVNEKIATLHHSLLFLL